MSNVKVTDRIELTVNGTDYVLVNSEFKHNATVAAHLRGTARPQEVYRVENGVETFCAYFGELDHYEVGLDLQLAEAYRIRNTGF